MGETVKFKDPKWLRTFFIWFSIIFFICSTMTTYVIIFDYPSISAIFFIVEIFVCFSFIISIVLILLSFQEDRLVKLHTFCGYLSIVYVGVGVMYLFLALREIVLDYWHYGQISIVIYIVSLITLFGDVILSLFLVVIGIDYGSRTKIRHVKISSIVGFVISVLSPFSFILFYYF